MINKINATQYAKVIEFYTKEFNYISKLPSFHLGFHHTTEILLEMLSKANIDNKKFVADVCCGLGSSAIYLHSRFNFNVFGLDITAVNIDECQSRISEMNINSGIEFICINVLDLDSLGHKFDIIWSEDSFSHIPDRNQLLKVLMKCLNPNGILIFNDLVRTKNISKEELDDQQASWRMHDLESTESYINKLNYNGFNVFNVKDNMGSSLAKFHDEENIKLGLGSYEEKLITFRKDRKSLIDLWGYKIYKQRLERLKTYGYLMNNKLDYTFILALN